MLDTLSRALQWADSHGLALPVLLGAVTVLVRAVWAVLRPVAERRWPRAVPVVEALGVRVAAVLPDVLAALARRRRPVEAPSAPTGQSGRAEVGALVILAAVGLVGVTACPRLPPVSGCTPGAQRCEGDRPEVCSATRRWHPVGDVPCSAVGGVCVVGLAAHCATANGGVR